MFKVISSVLHAVSIGAIAFILTNPQSTTAVDPKISKQIEELKQNDEAFGEIALNIGRTQEANIKNFYYLQKTNYSQCQINNKLLHTDVYCPKPELPNWSFR